MAKARAVEAARTRVRVADKGNAADKAGQVQSLQRALSILQTLAHSHDGLTLTELSQTVGLAPSTSHRLLTTLQQQQFARFDPIGNVWQVGVGAFTVGNAFVRTRDVALMARPLMRGLMEESGETVNLYVEDGGEAMCLTQIECRQLMRAIARPGGRVKMHCSSVGKAILAWLPDRDVSKVLERHGLPTFTAHTIATPRGLRDDLARIRARGYAVDDEEHAVGMRCVAAPIFDEHGRPAAALSVSGPAARIDDARLAVLGSLVVAAAGAATRELGGLSATREAS
ncbi:IclR family transcriptional regulator domain-containing protein [Azospirillum sp. ST 5-10]|uniref:IclR family transcriptional regulator domain-containing protein n=1 Tax=unclassified Azospirillum TaxID=2630922 RepID=UPI003F4A6EB9